jgi:hypothetical protein
LRAIIAGCALIANVSAGGEMTLRRKPGQLPLKLLVIPVQQESAETAEITIEDQESLRNAVTGASLPCRLTNIVGKHVELIGLALPSFASKAIASATSKGSKPRSR